MKKSFVILISMIVLVTTSAAARRPQPTPDERWGALAYSRSTGKTGAAYDFPTREAATRQAMRDCGERDCKVITAFQDSCGALALGKNDIGHAGRGSTLAEARQAALATCQERGGASCRIIRNTCSSGTPINSSSSSSGGTEDHYGAIAYSTATAKTGAAYNFPTREAAERQALRDCGQSDCHVEIWFRGECGALALGKNNVRAGAWSTAHASAESAALDACAQKGGQACKIIRSTCTR